MEVDISYVILICDIGHVPTLYLWEELGLKFAYNAFLGSDPELGCSWFGFLLDPDRGVFQIPLQRFLNLCALPAD